MTEHAVEHSSAYRKRRFLNWFPLGLSYAFLYMGRYNLTIAKAELGDLMTKEDFGIIFAAGTVCYAFAFLINGPLVDRIGGRKGMLIGVAGSAAANLTMGLYLRHVLGTGNIDNSTLRVVFSALYAINMFFQSYGAVSIVKVNASWFHVDERGGFSGIFGTMISTGILFAFAVNPWLLSVTKDWLGSKNQWFLFVAPAVVLSVMWFVEFALLRDRPSEAGHEDFDTGDASSGDTSDEPIPVMVLFKRIFTNPIIMTVAAIEFCTGVLRNGVMHWFPIYAKEVWVLPSNHLLVYGEWKYMWLIGLLFAVAVVSAFLASKAKGSTRVALIIFAVLAALAPFVQQGWGGLLFVAGVLGGNLAGWVSQLFFQSRRAPAAGGLYFVLTLCTVGMIFVLAKPGTEVATSKHDAIAVGDQIIEIAGKKVTGWEQVRSAIACWAPTCKDSAWNASSCVCTTKEGAGDPNATAGGPIPLVLKRGGKTLTLEMPDPRPVQRAGAKRKLKARPVLPLSPWWLGIIVFLMSMCVIGTHGLLSGTATMDFGGRKGAATTVGIIDGFVYLGTALQSISLGYLTSANWSYWPLFLLPFGIIGSLLSLRIWNAKPKGASAH